MKLSVLSEAKAMDGFGAEHGLSFLLEEDGKKILFDTGASGLFLSNARKMGIDLEEVDAIVLSHGHWDHGNGLQHITAKPLHCHPGCFQKRYRKLGGENIGLSMGKPEIAQKFQVLASARPAQLTEHLWFLGEIPRRNDFEAKTTKYVLEDGSPDFILDDSGMVCITDRGLVLISGCAHSGICNMMEYAKELTGISLVLAVIGGFHLGAVSYQTLQTVEYLKGAGVVRVLPSHCTTGAALDLILREFGSKYVRAGDTFLF